MSEHGPPTLANLPGYLAYVTPDVTGLWFHGRTLSLDGYRFKQCRFDACELQVNAGEFELDHCLISPDTRIVYGPNLFKPLQLFVTRSPPQVRQIHPNFIATVNADGTVTIK